MSVLLAFAAAVVLVMAACAEEAEPPQATPTDTGTPAPTFTTLEEGVLKVGSCLEYEPFESIEGGDEVGFDVDLTEEIAKRIGLEVKWIRADFETIFTAVDAGQFDMVAAAVTATGKDGEERDQTVDFSDFYFNSRQSLIVNTTETPDVTSTDDLGSGDTVGVQKGTTGKAWAKENLEPQGVEIRTYTAAPDAFRDLEAGAITAVVNDEQSSAAIIEDLPSLELVQGIDTNEKYALAFAEENDGLTEAVNVALAEIIADGTYETIFERYFPGQEVPPEFQASA
jgi:polar amino acid transport system substrate-binding protein